MKDKRMSFDAKSMRNLLTAMKKLWASMASYCYNACDAFVKRSMDFIAYTFEQIQSNNKLLLKITYFALPMVVLLLISWLVIRQTYFIVPVGSSAVVTRMGAYQREAEEGLNFRLPIFDKYYVVETGNLMEETFGFLQVTPPVNNPELTPAEKLVQDNYEAQLLQAEKQSSSVFAEKTDILDALGKKQRLPNDYLRRKYAPKETVPPQGAVNWVQQKEQELNTAKKSSESLLNGRVPINRETTLITGDLNIVHLTWTLQYKIANARNYLFNSQDVQQNIKDIGKTMMNEVIGSSLLKDIMTTERAAIERKAKEKIQALFDAYALGIQVNQVIILDAIPVQEVLFAFNEVNKAAQDMEKSVYEAEREYENLIPESLGEAKRIEADAQAYATKLVNEAIGEAQRFNVILTEYEKAPKVTEDRLYIETVENILKKTPTTIIDAKVRGVVPIYTGKNNTATNDKNIVMPSGVKIPAVAQTTPP
jgi:HflK protein